jgi:hypothetical protein
MSYGTGDARMVKLAELWERTSARGTRYFSGFMGDAQVLLFDGGEKPHPTKPDETVHVWRLMVQERDPARRQQSRGDPPAKSAAQPQERGQGWRGPSQYRRPANGAQRGPEAAGEAFYEDSLEDVGR